MNISEKKNTGFIVLVTLLVVLVIGLIGYIAYDKISEIKKNDDVVENEEVINQNKNNNKELTKTEKNDLIKNEVNELVKLLNSNYEESSTDVCSQFGVSYFSLFKGEDILRHIDTLLMSCRYGLKYIEVENYSPINPKAYLMTQDMYKKFQEFFSSSIEETTMIDNVLYYVAAVDGDGYALRQYNFVLNENIAENNGVYSVTFNIVENPEAFGVSKDEAKLVGTAELKVSVKNNHIYYESFNVKDVLTKE